MQPSVTWCDVAPLLARWQIALVPETDGTWDARAFGVPLVPPYGCHHVRFADLPQVIAAVAAWCAAEEEGLNARPPRQRGPPGRHIGRQCLERGRATPPAPQRNSIAQPASRQRYHANRLWRTDGQAATSCRPEAG